MGKAELEARRLGHFVAVYECGNFSAAANLLCISQPALSNSIRKLEEHLDVELFERNPRGVEPTVFGESLYRRTRLIRTEQQRAIEEIAALREGVSGTLRVGAGPSVVDQLADVVRLLVEARPALVLSLTEGPEEVLHRSVRDGEIDFALSTMSAHGIRDGELDYEALYTNPTVPMVRAAHPLAMRKSLGWRDLAEFPWIIGDSRLEPLDRQLLDAASTWNPPSVVTSNSAALMRSLVADSDFVTFMPATLATRKGARSLIAVGPPKGVFTADIGLTRRRDSTLPPTADVFIAEFRNSCADLGLKRARRRMERL